MDNKTCCFTGHRPSRFSFKDDESATECLDLKRRLQLEIGNMIAYTGVRTFMAGMALGVDTWAAEIVLELKEKYPDIVLIATVPCPEQAENWSKKNKERYYNILDLCDEVRVISPEWSYKCMEKRNRYMVDNSDYVIAVWDGVTRGGTYNTITYAKKKNRSVVIIKSEEKR